MNDEISQIILEELREHRRESNERHSAIDIRIRHVEKWQADAGGKVTMLGIILTSISGVIAWIAGIFKHG